MSLCNVCRSVPFRKLINSGREAVEDDGFRFNLVGRTSPRFSDHLPWDQRRCTVPELVSRAKTCRLCANILLRTKEHEWCMGREWETPRLLTWEEAKAAIPRNPMIWMVLYPHKHLNWVYNIALGDPHRKEILGLTFKLVKTFGKFHYTKHDKAKPDWVLKKAR